MEKGVVAFGALVLSFVALLRCCVCFAFAVVEAFVRWSVSSGFGMAANLRIARFGELVGGRPIFC